jgi:hypothetical protein
MSFGFSLDEIAAKSEREQWKDAEIARLRAALDECGADFISEPCTGELPWNDDERLQTRG